MKRIRRIVALLSVSALSAGTLVLAGGSAGADIVPDLSFKPAAPGTLSIGGEDFNLPTDGTEIRGDWDDVTGEFTGDFDIGSGQVTVTDPVPATIDVSISTSGVTGTFDPGNGDVDLATTVDVQLNIISPVVATCTISGVDLALSSTKAGGEGFDPAQSPAAWAFTVTDQGFGVPGSTCDNAAITPVLNGALGLPTSDTSIELSFGPLVFRLTEDGQIQLGGLVLPIPVEGTGLFGSLNEVEGFSGDLELGFQSIPDFEVDLLGTIHTARFDVTMTAGPVTGTWNTGIGKVELNTEIDLEIEIFNPPDASDSGVCTIQAVPVAMSTANPGGVPFEPGPVHTWEFVVTDQGFPAEAAECDTPLGTALFNFAFELPTDDTSIIMSFESGMPPPPVPPPPSGNGTEVGGETEETTEAKPATATPSRQLPFTG